jgi:hypothetical protein
MSGTGEMAQALFHLGSVIAALGVAVGIIFSFALLGRSIRLALPTIEWSPMINMLWDLFIGVTSAAFITTVLGMLGFYNSLVITGLLGAGPLLNLRKLDALRSPWEALCELVSSLREQGFLGLIPVITLAIVILPTATPEIFYDALYYHLGLIWQDLIAGELQWRPGVVHSAFPAYLDVLFGIGLWVGGAGAAKFFNLLLFLLGWCATAAFVHEVMRDKQSALVSAVTVSTIPGVVIMSTMCAIDAALIGFAAAAALAIARMRSSKPDELTRLSVLAAICAGFVAGSKYTGLWLVAALALSILTSLGPRRSARPASLFLATAMVVAGPWYLRNLLLTGDPIYPVLSGLLDNGNAQWAIERLRRDVPSLGLSWASLKALAVGLVHNPERFGAGAETGLLMPLGIGALLAGAWRFPLLRPWTVALAAYTGLWLSQSSVVRYLYPIFPLSALGVAWVSHSILKRWRRPPLVTAVLAILALVPLSQSIRVLDSLYIGSDVAALFSGGLSERDYLSRRLPYYPAALWLNSHTPSNARVLYLGETRLLYLDRLVNLSSAYDVGETARLLAPESPPLFNQLRNQGITHIVINGREIERLHAAYDYLSLPADAERRLRAELEECRIVFRKSGVQICELPS